MTMADKDEILRGVYPERSEGLRMTLVGNLRLMPIRTLAIALERELVKLFYQVIEWEQTNR
jgi:hypothetical protein